MSCSNRPLRSHYSTTVVLTCIALHSSTSFQDCVPSPLPKKKKKTRRWGHWFCVRDRVEWVFGHVTVYAPLPISVCFVVHMSVWQLLYTNKWNYFPLLLRPITYSFPFRPPCFLFFFLVVFFGAGHSLGSILLTWLTVLVWIYKQRYWERCSTRYWRCDWSYCIFAKFPSYFKLLLCRCLDTLVSTFFLSQQFVLVWWILMCIR